jgi:DNA gyrase subunit A
MVTRQGILKKTDMNVFQNAKKGGIIALNLKKNDELVDVKVVDKGDDIVIASRNGHLLRTNLMNMRSMGRAAAGIIGMRLSKDDAIIDIDIVKKNTTLFVITSKGFGKRVNYQNFATKGRGGKGMAYVKVSDKNGTARGIKSVNPSDEIIITSKNGMTIRLTADDVSLQGRSTIGVKLLELKGDDYVTDFAVISE